MPAYNAAAHIREAVDSILAQSFEDFELLVVDDGSTDNTLALVQAVDDRRMRVERLPANMGRATARNMALGRWKYSMPFLRRIPKSIFAVQGCSILGIQPRLSSLPNSREPPGRRPCLAHQLPTDAHSCDWTRCGPLA